jgi:hypothetical protein
MAGPTGNRGDADTTIGQLLVEAGACSEYDLNKALQYQRRHPEIRLGECLVKMGRCSAAALELVLKQQTAFRSGRPEDVVKLYDAMGKASRAVERSVAAMHQMSLGGHHV